MTTVAAEPVPFLDLSSMHAEIATELADVWGEVTRSGAFIGGAAVAGFESDWAAYCGRRHAVGVANGTDALLLVLRALGIGPGDEVVVPANTFVATVEAVVLAGATPRFADVDADTLLMTPATVEPVLGPATAAIVVVHLYGGLPDMHALGALAAAAGVPLVEDAAHAHGARFRGRRAGSFGRAACFSFYPGKNLGAFGDAGAVVTDDPALAEVVASLADHGRDPADRHLHPRVGTNSRLDGLQAAVLSCKLRRLDDWNAARRSAMERYAAGLDGLAVVPVMLEEGAESVHHLNVVRVADRDAVRARLREHGIATGVHYRLPCHRQPAFERFASGGLEVAEHAAGRILSLPLSPHITEGQIERVCAALAEATGEAGEDA